MYLFIHTEGGPYDLIADVKYSATEPEVVLDEFNAQVEGYEQFGDAYLMEFVQVDDDEICTKLLGNPSDWNYEDAPPKLLMQYDPLDNEMDFLDTLDGFVYLFFGENEKDFRDVTLREEYT